MSMHDFALHFSVSRWSCHTTSIWTASCSVLTPKWHVSLHAIISALYDKIEFLQSILFISAWTPNFSGSASPRQWRRWVQHFSFEFSPWPTPVQMFLFSPLFSDLCRQMLSWHKSGPLARKCGNEISLGFMKVWRRNGVSHCSPSLKPLQVTHLEMKFLIFCLCRPAETISKCFVKSLCQCLYGPDLICTVMLWICPSLESFRTDYKWRSHVQIQKIVTHLSHLLASLDNYWSVTERLCYYWSVNIALSADCLPLWLIPPQLYWGTCNSVRLTFEQFRVGLSTWCDHCWWKWASITVSMWSGTCIKEHRPLCMT